MNYKKNNIFLSHYLLRLKAICYSLFIVIFLTNYSFSQETQETCPIDVTGITQPANKSVLGYDRPYTTNLPECKNIASGVVAKPGSNCLYDGKPLCGQIPSSEYSVSSQYILSSGQIHRYNCHDLIDLPICDDLGSLADSRKNCALRCSQISNSNDPAFIRSQDYAVHNRDCIRFCDETNLETAIPNGVNPACVTRSCHQLGNTTPSPSNNCNLLACNMLYKEELAKVADNMRTSSTFTSQGTYCNRVLGADNKTLKCYKFSESQLPYTIRDKMCVMNNCAPQCTSYKSQLDVNDDGVINQNDDDDTLNISGKGITRLGEEDSDYTQLYNFYINNCQDLSDQSLCNKVICRPIIKKQYRCTTDGTNITGSSSQDKVRNNSCDASGDGSSCKGNYCYKSVDCNLEANNSKQECIIPPDETFGTTEDFLNSWFYRPKPMPKATNSNGVLYKMDGGLCYSESNYEDDIHDNDDDRKWGKRLKRTIRIPGFPSFPIDLGYFHSSIRPDQTRSPGMCRSGTNISVNAGWRGTGYPYLCFREDGTGGGLVTGGLYQKVASHTAYHKGYVKTTFLENDNALHQLTVCLRFRNALRPDDGKSETCGARECATTCMGFMGGCSQQNCGFDVCRNMQIEDLNPDECAMNNYFFNNKGDKGCSTIVDDYLRIRIQKYGDYICSFLDVKSQTAYEIDWLAEGNEVVVDDYCIDGSIKGSGKCNGKNTKDEPGKADVWRTIKFGDTVHIPYIGNNQPAGSPRGYLDKDGQLFLEQNCIKATLRRAPEDLYNLATSSNSPRLFVPPIYIVNARTYRGGSVAIPTSTTEKYGETSFHYPEIEVRFGDTSKLLSLGVNYIGNETGIGDSKQDPKASATISTTVNSVPYSEDIFVQKEYNQKSFKPIFCLYQKVKNISGTYLAPFKIGCVDRELPEIDNFTKRIIDPNLKAQKLVISDYNQNTYDNSFISLKYLADFGENKIDNKCAGDDICTPNLLLNNTDISSPNCNDGIEAYQVCVKRDSCSQLNIECMNNEINMQNAILDGTSTSKFLAIRNSCNNYILPVCNNKKGLLEDSMASIYKPNSATPDPKAYGWFNEICFTSGLNTKSFNHNLKQVIAHNTNKVTNNVMGKCIINPNSPYLTDNNPATNCDDGGFAPNCLCVEYIEGLEISVDQEVRTQTTREAGLCIDMPKPKTCPEINFNTIPNPNDSSDPNYVNQSLNINNGQYGTSLTKVHTSHQARTLAIGHAEFSEVMMGVSNFAGQCNGFWKNSSSGTGVSINPTRSCLNESGNAVWNDTVNNHCVRYNCPQIATNGIYDNGNYQGGYGLSESGQDKGLKDGFALWPYHLQTTDFAETITANSCIIGFKKSGSSPVATSDGTAIAKYNGGVLATRDCNQLGQWQTTSNNCQRIKCSPVNVPTNYGGDYQTIENYYISKVKNSSGSFVNPSFSYSASSPNPTHKLDDYSYTGRYAKNSSGVISNVQWSYWVKSGGAIFFDETLASRSDQFIENTSKTLGYCNRELGFFQAGTQRPTLECDHLGNWEVKNKCVTRCDIVSAGIDSEDENNGFSSWVETDVASEDVQKQVAGTCIPSSQSTAGKTYIPYPYPPLRDIYGKSYKIYNNSSAYITFLQSLSLEPHISLSQFTTTQSANTIPVDVKSDTRTHYNDPSDSIAKWLQAGNSVPIGATASTNYPTPTRLCKWVNDSTGISTSFWQPADSRCISGCPSGTYDPRINVGVTKHNIYDANSPTKTKEFYISWPQADFGTTIYKTNLGFSIGSPNIDKNASDFSTAGRDNGEYIVARKCGDDGKWEDSIPQCATNKGSIAESNAIYDSESKSGTKTLNVGGIASSTECSEGYLPNNSDTETPDKIIRYSCEYSDNNNKNINQTYFKPIEAENEKPCALYCSVTTGDLFGKKSSTVDGVETHTYTAKYTGEGTKIVKKGDSIDISCNDGYGKAMDDELKTTEGANYDNTCGRESYDRTDKNPKIKCSETTDGEFEEAIENNCTKCRGCNGDSASYDSETVSEVMSCNSDSREASSIVSACGTNAFSIKHEEFVKVGHTKQRRCTVSGKCRERNICNAAKFKCIDGALQYTSDLILEAQILAMAKL